jgi:hypothetical protein
MGAFMGAWDDKLYLAGGTRQLIDPYPPVNRVDVYDITFHTWTAGGGRPMLVATDFAGSIQAGPYLYIAGGFVGDGINLHDETQRFNMATNIWELGPPLSIPQFGGGLAITGSAVFLVADAPYTWNPLDKVDVLELADWPGGVWTGWDPLPQVNIYPATACTEAMAGGEVWAVGGGDGDIKFYDDNMFHPAEPCVDFGMLLTPESPVGEGNAGDTLSYALTITNTGTITDYFRLSATSLWAITLPETDVVGPLGHGESAVITVSVTIPADAGGGDSDTAVVTVTSIGNIAGG